MGVTFRTLPPPTVTKTPSPAPATAAGAATPTTVRRIDSFRAASVTPSPVPEPTMTVKVTWDKPASDAQLFFHGTPSPSDIRQGPVGDCFTLSPLASAAVADPTLMTEHIRQVGVAADGEPIYGAVFYIPSSDAKTVAKFERAAADVTDPEADPSTGKHTTYTPVWVLVDNRIAHEANGHVATAEETVPNEGNIAWVALSEKAEALKRGTKTGFRTIMNGGQPSEAMSELSGRHSVSAPITRAVDPAADKAMADQQFAEMQHSLSIGKSVVASSSDTPSVRKQLIKYPHFDAQGHQAAYFDPHHFKFADGDGNAASTGMAAITATDSKLGAGWVSDHAYSVLRAYEQHGVKMVELRNPWGDVRPPEFTDGTQAEDGIVRVPWYIARELFYQTDTGGRDKAHREPLVITKLPTLPAGAKPV